jgi:hypothetical protein
VVVPLVFRHGAAEVAFNVAVVAWLVFEFVMRVRQRLRASGPADPDRSAFVQCPPWSSRSSRPRCLAAAAGCRGREA